MQKIGAVGVSTMPMLRTRELAHIVNDSEARVVVCQRALMDEIARARPSFDPPVVGIAAGRTAADLEMPEGADAWLEDLAGAASDHLDTTSVDRDAVALIAYKSGSTGVPKGATHTPADSLSTADCYSRHVLRPGPADVFGGHPTLAFTIGLGGQLAFPPRWRGDHLSAPAAEPRVGARTISAR